VLDGWSVAVFFDQLMAAYSGSAVTSADMVCQLAAEAESRALSASESARHWADVAREWHPLAIRSRQQQDDEPPTWLAARPFEFGLRDEIKQASAVWRCSVKNLFLAAHLRALELAAGPGTVSPGALVVTNARPQVQGTHRALGMFLNMVPVLPSPSSATWRDRVEHVTAAEAEAQEHRHFPFGMLLTQLHLPRPTTCFNFTDFTGAGLAGYLAKVTEHNITEVPLTVAVVDDGLIIDGSSRHFTHDEVSVLADMHMECLREALQAALSVARTGK
jgi:hypothetical protein